MIQAALHHSTHRLLVLLLLLSATISAHGKETSEPPRRHYPPLFPIQLKTPYPKPAKTFQELLSLVRDNYYSDDISEQALYRAATEGILRYVSPPQLKDRRNLWSPEEYSLIVEALTGVQSTVGIKSNFNPMDGALTVREVLPGSPAQTLLLPLDRIMRINGESLKGKSAQAINALLRGKPGATVHFKVVRDIHILDVEIQLELFKASPVSSARLPDAIAYIALRKMAEGSAADVSQRIQKLRNKGNQGLILDLRGNGGGLFSEALKLAEVFLPARRQVALTLQRGGRIKSFVSGNTRPVNLKLVLLVDKKTASAAEILAAALQGNGRARIVGTTSFGKATLEQTFKLNNGYHARFIIGALYGPGGRTWYGTGVRPDLVVNASAKVSTNTVQPLDERLARDPQLLAAWRLLH